MTPDPATGNAKPKPESVPIDKTIQIDTITARDAKKHRGDARVSKNSTRKKSETKRKTKNVLTDSLHIFSEQQDVEDFFDSGQKKTRENVLLQDKYAEEHFLDIERHYEIHERFSEGGQGVISLGYDKALHRDIAVKSLRRNLCKDHEERTSFISESVITAQLDHPSITPIYALNTDSKQSLHLVMKLLNGQTLKHYLDRVATTYRLDGFREEDERKSLQSRLEIFLRICDAMEYAHSRNIMHCDLKPENIMICGFQETYIMDWGIAKLIRDPEFDAADWISPKQIAGTPRFLTPEALRGEKCDQRADIFAMGLILFELVTLQEAFVGSTKAEVISLIREGRIAAVEHRFKYPIDSDLRAIILKATAHDREDRYKKVSMFSEDIRRFLNNEELLARPDNSLRTVVRWGKNHNKTALISAFLTVLIALSIIAFSAFSEISALQTKNVQMHAVATAFARGLETGALLDKQFSKHQQSLETIADEVNLLLEAESAPENIFPTYEVREVANPNVGPPGLDFSDIYQREIDLKSSAWKTPNYILGPNTAKRVQRLSSLRPRLYRSLLLSAPNAVFTPETISVADEKITKEGLPLHIFCFGFQDDGLFFVYPANPNYATSYDPRKRPWYKTCIKGDGNAVWTSPYRGIHSGTGYLISCTVPILDADDQAIGVAFVDVLLSHYVKVLRTSGNTGDCVVEKVLVNHLGDVLISTSSAFQRYLDQNTSDYSMTYQHPEIIADARLNRTGYIQKNEDGVEYVYIYYHLQNNNWTYIEKLSLPKLHEEAAVILKDGNASKALDANQGISSYSLKK